MYLPPGFNTVTRYFFIEQAERFVAFLVAGLGGMETGRHLRPDGLIAWSHARDGRFGQTVWGQSRRRQGCAWQPLMDFAAAGGRAVFGLIKRRMATGYASNSPLATEIPAPSAINYVAVQCLPLLNQGCINHLPGAKCWQLSLVDNFTLPGLMLFL